MKFSEAYKLFAPHQDTPRRHDDHERRFGVFLGVNSSTATQQHTMATGRQPQASSSIPILEHDDSSSAVALLQVVSNQSSTQLTPRASGLRAVAAAYARGAWRLASRV